MPSGDGKIGSILVRGDELRVKLSDQQQTERIARRESDIPITQTLVGLGVKPEELTKVDHPNMKRLATVATGWPC